MSGESCTVVLQPVLDSVETISASTVEIRGCQSTAEANKLKYFLLSKNVFVRLIGNTLATL